MPKKRKTLDKYIDEVLDLKDTNEYIIFLVWSLLVVSFLVSLLK